MVLGFPVQRTRGGVSSVGILAWAFSLNESCIPCDPHHTTTTHAYHTRYAIQSSINQGYIAGRVSRVRIPSSPPLVASTHKLLMCIDFIWRRTLLPHTLTTHVYHTRLLPWECLSRGAPSTARPSLPSDSLFWGLLCVPACCFGYNHDNLTVWAGLMDHRLFVGLRPDGLKRLQSRTARLEADSNTRDSVSGQRGLIRAFTVNYMMDHIACSLSTIFMPVCSALGVAKDVLISRKAPFAGIFANGLL